MSEQESMQRKIFEKGSKTYFNSSVFFPKDVRRQVFTLYAFVRVADDYVDATPQDGDGFRAFRSRWSDADRSGAASRDPVIDPYVALSRERGFERAWTEAFLDAMEADLSRKTYDVVEDTLGYIYGSAEVVGLFMARIMDLPQQSHAAAMMLGRAMQYVNFIRDFAEDLDMGRRYLPFDGFDSRVADPDWAKANPDVFSSFLRHHLERYKGWAAEAAKGYRFIPKRYRIPIVTAQDMYDWSARRIEEDPLVVFERKVKPSKGRIVRRALRNALFA